ncbi:hypothetical protein BDQ12DRAFT_680207 [Crucibulum laeve]|uniref:Uncharacterized protein n=1 Tax=Crucibulum laeve TaxID=68775 RepID=A0A5C3M864_9AGAR|nr:hypothetical protein BDQ12DRAFT_680207 [Crucibulum laeve]
MEAATLAIDSAISSPSRPAPGAPDPYHNYERPPGQSRHSNDSNQLFQLQVGLTKRLQCEDKRRKAQQAEKSQQADNFLHQQNSQGLQVQLPSPALDQTPQECILSTTGFASTNDFFNLSEADFDRWVMARSQLPFCEDKPSTPLGASAEAKALNTIPSISLTPASPTISATPASLTIVAPRPRYYHQVPKAWVRGSERTFEDYVAVARPDSSPVDITSQAKQDTYVQQDYTQPSSPTPSHVIQDTILKESTSNPGTATQSTSQAGQQEQASSVLTPGTSRVIKRVTATFYIKEEEDDDTGLEYIDYPEDDIEPDSTEGRSLTQGSASSHALSQVSTSSETLSSAPATPTSSILSFADIVIPSEEEAAAVLASFMAHVRKECEHTRTTNVTPPSFRDAFMAAVRVSMQVGLRPTPIVNLSNL